MSVACYSTCRIQFVPNNSTDVEKQYSERSLIELRQHDFDLYSLRAVDVENNREEIFNIPFKGEADYQRGASANNPDQIRSRSGTYSLWLHASSRTGFHDAIDSCIQAISFLHEPSSPPAAPPARSSTKSSRDDQEHSSLSRHSNKNNILVDVHQLGQAIREGNVEEAVRLSKILANRSVQLQASPWKAQRESEIFPIRIKIDGNKQETNTDNAAELVMSVYPSTTIRELRAAFESLKQFPPVKQYFFVNGRLAHDYLSMIDLEIRPNTLFVLFVIQ